MNNNNHKNSNGHSAASVSSENGKYLKDDQVARIDEISNSYMSILRNVGENPHREGLLKTPERAAKAMIYLTKGYRENLQGL